MKASYIDYSQTHSFTQAVLKYVEKDPSLAPFMAYEASFEGFEAYLSDKKDTSGRKILADTLTDQYSGLNTTEKVSENIRLLEKGNTFTITTGHQLNLFTGPLYFIFKIATTIKLCLQLKDRFPDKNFVPVYWMATEDHDFEEIDHTYVAGKKIRWERESGGAAGRMDLKDIEDAIHQYRNVLGLDPNGLHLASLVEKAYSQINLAAATRYLVNELFKDHGLVILDADDRRLKTGFVPYITRDIIEQNSYEAIEHIDIELKKAGIEAQVHPREINFFYLTDGLRERIVYEHKKYNVLNTGISFTEAELTEEIKTYPERFSPNVVMRPLYQEVILPNLAYVGGGAEIVYWLQLKENFDHYKVQFPILVLRNSALIATENSCSKLDRLGLKWTDLFTDTDELLKNWILANSQHDLSLADEQRQLNSIFEQIKLRAHKIDSTLVNSTDASRARLEHAIKNLEKKLIKAEKRNYETAIGQVLRLKEKVLPKGTLQERKENMALFYVKHGSGFIDELIRHFQPLDFKFTILYEA